VQAGAWRDGLEATLYMTVLDSLRYGWAGGGGLVHGAWRMWSKWSEWWQFGRRQPAPTARGVMEATPYGTRLDQWACVPGHACSGRFQLAWLQHVLLGRTRRCRACTQVRVGVAGVNRQSSIVSRQSSVVSRQSWVVYAGIAQRQGN
jgi:hypothetical protein